VQLTLVSHYGEKPAAFTELIARLQQQLAQTLGDEFTPYSLQQIHATIAGLEGTPRGAEVLNNNFARHRRVERAMNFNALLDLLQSEHCPRLSIRIGGFAEEHDWKFMSNGQHPFVRSFSIQGQIAVAMGWPFEHEQVTDSLTKFRRTLETFGVLHKWHRIPADADNDFFFVLGRVQPSVSREKITRAETLMRRLLAQSPVTIEVDRDTLSFVAYTDSQLPLESSRTWKVTDGCVSAQALADVYAE
jgi:hypothetical protein